MGEATGSADELPSRRLVLCPGMVGQLLPPVRRHPCATNSVSHGQCGRTGTFGSLPKGKRSGCAAIRRNPIGPAAYPPTPFIGQDVRTFAFTFGAVRAVKCKALLSFSMHQE
jgi:hypothetical protein